MTKINFKLVLPMLDDSVSAQKAVNDSKPK
jgi:hypothetical protein